MIVDCFTFYNELDLLNYRLNLLNDHVDYFVLVESNQTHAGNPKKLYYQDNIHLFENFKNKIIHVVVDLDYLVPDINYSRGEQWINENKQRNSIDLGIKRLSLYDTDLIIISDLDEIVDPDILGDISSDYSLEMDLYYYNLRTKFNNKWSKGKMVTFKTYSGTSPNNIRNTDYPLIKNAGWHLSYFGDPTFIQNKLKEFGHQEFNTTNFTDLSVIDNNIKGNLLLFNKTYINKIDTLTNNYLPKLWNIYLQNFN
jgi:beta-1,4-mannosyl-glycoprotein beta-1,4-N-acetylglucosaminyltransferase